MSATPAGDDDDNSDDVDYDVVLDHGNEGDDDAPVTCCHKQSTPKKSKASPKPKSTPKTTKASPKPKSTPKTSKKKTVFKAKTPLPK